MKKLWLAALAALALAAPAQAQTATADLSKYVELLRSDLRTTRTEIVTEALALSEAQGTAFWPIYREYEKDVAALGDQRIALIKEYAENYDTMTDDMAKNLAGRAFKLQEQRGALVKKYYGKASKVITPKLAARWAQVESALNSLIDLQVASELPLMK